MATSQVDLARLLQPIAIDRFFAHYWEREPLLLHRADPTYYQELLSLADIEAFIARGDARYPAIRLAKGGTYYAPERYTHDVRYGDEYFRGVPDLEKIHTEYSCGATITLPAWHRACPALGRLCWQMETQLDHAVSANVYLTPPRAAGFTAHYDTHEVFVLQIAGHKQWQVYPPPLTLPHRSQTFDFEHYAPPATALLQCELATGDLLYLPRGYVHSTATSERPSAHVSIGVTVYTWVELVSELIQSTIGEGDFRGGLPPGFARRPELRAALTQRFGSLLQQLCQTLDIDALCQRFIERTLTARARPPLPFQADASGIGPDARLCITAHGEYSLAQEQDGLVLDLGGRRVRLQPSVAPALQAMCRMKTFTAQTLPADISLEARLSLVRYLHGLGFLQTI